MLRQSVNIEIKVRLPPRNKDLVYAQNWPALTHSDDENIVTVALMQEIDIITTLLFSG